MKAIGLNANFGTTTGQKAIADALNAVQEGCRARTLNLRDIKDIQDQVELELGVPRCKLAGTQITYTGAQHFPNAYKGRPESTQFVAEHNGREWHVIRIFRDTCPDRLSNTSVLASDITKEAILARFRNLAI